MKKKELSRLRTLRATPTMIRWAKNTKVTYKKYGWKNGLIKKYRYAMCIRCQQLSGYVKIAIFLTEELRKENTEARYELFINPQTAEFITYDCKEKKWTEAMLDKLDTVQDMWVYSTNERIRATAETKKTLRCTGIIGTEEKNIWNGILNYQQSRRREQLEEKHKRETDAWDEDLKQIPKEPKDWIQWIDRQAISENFIFYDYDKNGVKEGYCTYCKTNVPVNNPRYGKTGYCRKCRKQITYKSRGKAGGFDTKTEYVYLMQKCEDYFVIREYYVYRRYIKGEYEAPEIRTCEIRRAIYNLELQGTASRVYSWGVYKNKETRWVAGRPISDVYQKQNGTVYKRTLPAMKDAFKRSGLLEMIKAGEKIDPEAYLYREKDEPYIEQFAKAGLYKLTKEYTDGYRWNMPKINQDAKGLDKMLGIDKFRLKRLREMNGGIGELRWLRYEKEINTELKADVIQSFVEWKIEPDDIKFIQFMSLTKTVNYLKKQCTLTQRPPEELLSTWKDYLSMAKRLKMDLGNSLVYKPKDLKKAHDELVEIVKDKGLAIQAEEIAEKFGEMENVLAEIKPKFEYEDKKYAIIVPQTIEEILMESKVLSLCMDRTEIYWDRIEQRESFLVWLRRKEDIEKPWYVIEVQPGGNVRQKRTLGDNQNDDFEDAVKFIKKWQKEIVRRMTKEDRLLAEQSEGKRLIEMQKLREDGNRIHRGKLAGKLLADVLEADFMETGGIANVG